MSLPWGCLLGFLVIARREMAYAPITEASTGFSFLKFYFYHKFKGHCLIFFPYIFLLLIYVFLLFLVHILHIQYNIIIVMKYKRFSTFPLLNIQLSIYLVLFLERF